MSGGVSRRDVAENEFLDHAKNRNWHALFGLLRMDPTLVNAQPRGRWSALHQAAKADREDVVKELLRAGADPFVRTSDGHTPIDVAPPRGVVRPLLDGAAAAKASSAAPSHAAAPGAAVAIASADRTALEHIFLDHAKTFAWGEVRKMLDGTPDLVNVQPAGRMSALHQAVYRDDAQVVDFLLSRKADVNLRNSRGQRPIDITKNAKISDLLLAASPVVPASIGGGFGGMSRKRTEEVLGDAGAAGPGIYMAGLGRSRSDVSRAMEVDLDGAVGGVRAVASGASAGASSSGTRGGNILAALEASGCAVLPYGAATPIRQLEGDFSLAGKSFGPAAAKSGKYAFNPHSRKLMDKASGAVLGLFIDGQISPMPFPQALLDNPLTSGKAPLRMPCVRVVSSEIIVEIQNVENADAMFVLPSQLNGAEYPSHTNIVDRIDRYKSDNTGGPRGQLAVHPAAGQFILDNAFCDHRPGGINAVDDFLKEARRSMPSDAARWNIHLRNGYLALPALPASADLQSQVLAGLRAALHKMRCLGFVDVPACGLDPALSVFAELAHRVTLVYASAVPVKAYLNSDGASGEFQEEVGRLVLVGQYFGALRAAAALGRVRLAGDRQKVFLMPLGGGVFRNRFEVIVGAISSALELLAEMEPAALELLDVRVLAFSRSGHEGPQAESLLQRFGKAATSRADPCHPTALSTGPGYVAGDVPWAGHGHAAGAAPERGYGHVTGSSGGPGGPGACGTTSSRSSSSFWNPLGRGRGASG
eukprot:CAMPEP_0115586630 /NCGR_PEP_ID=MMETSP0272-20121206/7797_1 /TAXON_ID=71861 /ORGANISM="Scrippsiella trochoidea, Strain CCMP3099" /LENGTH=759 /DNA_ID=CAMNT_0003021699 /DNA_START=34 /DNA_END=2310 /DNA_ORIENTATION=+